MKKGVEERKILFTRPTKGEAVDRTGHPLIVILDSDTGYAYSKGHHDADEFCDAASILSGMFYDSSMVQYRWVRIVPDCRYDRKRRAMVRIEKSFSMLDTAPGKKGAFPITCCDLTIVQ